MWSVVFAVLLLLAALAAPAPVAHAQPGPYSVDGAVYSRTGQPISSLTVYLYHPTVGRSYPRFTDVNGYFIFERVAYAPTDYYLEVYWGTSLMYREAITIDRSVSRPYIILR